MFMPGAALVLALVLGCPRPASPPVPPSPSAPSRAAGPTPLAAPPPRADGRLPDGVRPTRYALELTIDPAQATFSGRARIAVTIDNPTRAIVMHGRGMTIQHSTLTAAGRTLAGHATLRMAALSKGEPEELVLTFDQPVPAGAAARQIVHRAPFAAGLRGVYRVPVCGDASAYTHLDPNDAQR